MDVLEAIASRRSISRLSPPAPTPEHLRLILAAAVRAPDHGTLRPWRFVVIEGAAKDAFGPVLAAATEAHHRDRGEEADPAKVDKDRTKMARAPMVVVAAVEYVDDPKVPRREQFAAVAAAVQNASLAATALGYGSMWRTGPNAENPHVVAALGLAPGTEIVGFLYLGTVEADKARPPVEPVLDGVVSHWSPP